MRLLTSTQLFDIFPGFLQVDRIEAFGEPVEAAGDKGTCLLAPALLLSEAAEAD
jgi:hypothetical protein